MANIRTFNNNVSVLVVSFSVENTEVWVYRKGNFINFFFCKVIFVIILFFIMFIGRIFYRACGHQQTSWQ